MICNWYVYFQTGFFYELVQWLLKLYGFMQEMFRKYYLYLVDKFIMQSRNLIWFGNILHQIRLVHSLTNILTNLAFEVLFLYFHINIFFSQRFSKIIAFFHCLAYFSEMSFLFLLTFRSAFLNVFKWVKREFCYYNVSLDIMSWQGGTVEY